MSKPGDVGQWARCRTWRLIEVDATLEGMAPHRARLLQLLYPATTVMDLNIGTALWSPLLARSHKPGIGRGSGLLALRAGALGVRGLPSNDAKQAIKLTSI